MQTGVIRECFQVNEKTPVCSDRLKHYVRAGKISGAESLNSLIVNPSMPELADEAMVRSASDMSLLLIVCNLNGVRVIIWSTKWISEILTSFFDDGILKNES